MLFILPCFDLFKQIIRVSLCYIFFFFLFTLSHRWLATDRWSWTWKLTKEIFTVCHKFLWVAKSYFIHSLFYFLTVSRCYTIEKSKNVEKLFSRDKKLTRLYILKIMKILKLFLNLNLLLFYVLLKPPFVSNSRNSQVVLLHTINQITFYFL